MSRYYSISSKLFAAAVFTAFVGLVGCGGGGGGGETVTYLTVVGTTPLNNATKVDARIPSITVNFSAGIDELSLLKEQSEALPKLLTKYGVSVVNLDGSAFTGTSITLKDLAELKYQLSIVHPTTQVRETLAISDYSFFVDGNDGYGLRLAINSSIPYNLDIRAKDVIESGLVNNKLFTVMNNTSGKALQGQITLSTTGSTLYFTPLRNYYFDWSSKYTVTISKDIKSTGGKNMSADYSWSFQTQELATPAVESASPVGSNANPLKTINVLTNFRVSSVNSSSVVVSKITRISADDPNPTETPIITTISLDSTGRIVVTPSELDYLQEYKVVVRGGLTGTMGNVSVTLAQDYTWIFTTGAPEVVAFSPANSSLPIVERADNIIVELNFRPNPASIANGIVITNTTNANAPVNVPFTLVGVTDGTITIRPTTNFNFSSNYSVRVLPSLVALRSSEIHLAGEYTSNFATVHRKVTTFSPSHLATGIDPLFTIRATFNFDTTQAALSNRSNFAVTKVRKGQSTETDVLGNVSYNSTTRELSFTPTTNIENNATIYVKINNTLPSADGSFLRESVAWSFTIKNDRFSIASYTPTGSYVMVNAPIQATMTHDVQGTVSTSALEVTCNGYRLSGSTYNTGNLIYFLASAPMRSFCNYTVRLSSSVRGVNDKEQDSSSTNQWSFTTDGLEVDSVYVTYAYGDYVARSSSIRVNFNYPVDYVFSSDIQLFEEGSFSPVSAYVSRSGSTVDVIPTSYLKYGTNYRLEVSTDVMGINGETLRGTDVTEFSTEELPVDVVDYGPTGDVYTDDIFWVEMSHSTSEQGFPDYSYSSLYSTSFGTLSRNMSRSGYDIYMEPANYMQSGYYYTPTFDFDFYNSNSMDFDWDWTVYVDPALNGALGAERAQALSVRSNDKQSAAKIQATRMMSREQRKAKGVRELRSCRNNLNCVGHFKTKSVAEYKLNVLANRRTVNIKDAGIRYMQKQKKSAQKIHAEQPRVRR